MSLLCISDLEIGFCLNRQSVTVVDDVCLELAAGERAIIIGESGCGKSLVAMAVLGILPPNAAVRGTIRFEEENLTTADNPTFQKIRATRIGYVPQSAGTCLNPVFRFQTQAREVLLTPGPGPSIKPAVQRLLKRVGLAPAVARMYPHQLSEGMKGRALFGLGTCREPDLLVADEPTKGLDNITKAELVALLERFSKNGTRSLLLITHDLDVAKALPGRLAVMYAGQFVEVGASHALLDGAARHPYTRGLLQSHPSAGLHPLPGKSPGILNRPLGCRFAGRCPEAGAECMRHTPALRRITGDHWVRCRHV